MDSKDIEIKYKLDPKTIKSIKALGHHTGVIIIGAGRTAGLLAVREALSKVTIPERPFMEIGINTEELEKALLALDESLICASEKIKELDFVSQFGIPPDMIEDIDKKIFVESPSLDFNVKGQEPIWMKGWKRWK